MKNKTAIILTILFGIFAVLSVMFSVLGSTLIKSLLEQEATDGGEAVGIVIVDIIMLPLSIVLVLLGGLLSTGSITTSIITSIKCKTKLLRIINIILGLTATVGLAFCVYGFILLK